MNDLITATIVVSSIFLQGLTAGVLIDECSRTRRGSGPRPRGGDRAPGAG
ncbi:MAG: hypothetical protein ACLPQY_01570 [Streptosporangiaceae bacterium]